MMRKALIATLMVSATFAAPANAKLKSPFSIKACYELGRDAIYDDQKPTKRIVEEANKYSELPPISTIMRNVNTFRNTAIKKHQAAQCRLRRQGKPYDQRCPGVVFDVDWVMENTPKKIFSMSREEGNGEYLEYLRDNFNAEKDAMEIECQQ